MRTPCPRPPSFPGLHEGLAWARRASQCVRNRTCLSLVPPLQGAHLSMVCSSWDSCPLSQARAKAWEQ